MIGQQRLGPASSRDCPARSCRPSPNGRGSADRLLNFLSSSDRVHFHCVWSVRTLVVLSGEAPRPASVIEPFDRESFNSVEPTFTIVVVSFTVARPLLQWVTGRSRSAVKEAMMIKFSVERKPRALRLTAEKTRLNLSRKASAVPQTQWPRIPSRCVVIIFAHLHTSAEQASQVHPGDPVDPSTPSTQFAAGGRGVRR